MKVSVETPSETTRSLKIEVPSERLEEYVEKESARVRQRVQMPGFRKGKAPLNLVMTQYGKQIEATAIENAIQENYNKAINDNNLNPIGPANIMDMSFEPGKSLAFTAHIEVEPDFTIGKLKGIRVEKEEPEVTDDMVENALKRVQLQFGTVSEKSEPAGLGDVLLIDIEEVDPATGVALIGKTYPDKTIRLGEQVFGPGFDEQLIGINPNEKRRVMQQIDQQVIATPQSKQQQGPLEIHYLVTAKKINAVSLPEIDDTLAENLKYKNVDELREGIKKDLSVQLNNAARDKFRTAIEREVVRIVNPPVPRAMIDRYLDNLIENFQKISLGEKDTGKLKEENKDLAAQKIQWYLIRQKLVVQEQFTVSDQEIDDFIEKLAEENKIDAKRAKSEYRSGEKREDLKSVLLDDKIFGFLEEKADVKAVKAR